jgi:flavin-dependent dehydrogenase
MLPTESTDILIIGAGPAGMSVALHLVEADAGWAERLLVIDKAIHPREKLCGGGVTRPAEAILRRLGLEIATPQIPIYQLRVIYGDEVYIFTESTPLFRVIRRNEFDHWLVQRGRERGVTVREGEAVKAIRPADDQVEVITNRAVIQAKTVVAADGSRSFVRQKLGWHNTARMARLLEVLTPEQGTNQTYFEEGVASLDITPMQQGVQGYYWDFPSLIDGQPIMNRGIFDSRVRTNRPRANLKSTLQELMTQRGRELNAYTLKGHPIHWFDPNGEFARPRIILAGDAAGVDSLVGEGIGFALGYGPVAADAISDAFAQQDFRFTDYRQRILSNPFLAEMKTRRVLARFIYGRKSPWSRWLAWRLGGPMISSLRRLSPRSMPFETPLLTKTDLLRG